MKDRDSVFTESLNLGPANQFLRISTKSGTIIVLIIFYSKTECSGFFFADSIN